MASAPYTCADLERALLAKEPSLVLVKSRVLRRLLKEHAQLEELSLEGPHEGCYVLDRESFLRLSQLWNDLPARAWSDAVVVLPEPDPSWLARWSTHDILTRYGQRLFHALIHRSIQTACKQGRLTQASIHARLAQLGLGVVAECRSVLEDERLLLRRDRAYLYEELTALFLELYYFRPELVPSYFPSMTEPDAVAQLLGEDLPINALLQQCRLVSAETPALAEPSSASTLPINYVPPTAPVAPTSAESPPDATGNVVRRLLQQVRKGQPSEVWQATLGLLVGRLQRALKLSPHDAHRWQQCLAWLVPNAARGFWPGEARLLFDVQKVCVDHEKPAYAVSVFDWALSWGKRPLKCLLPYHKLTANLAHWRSAAKRVRKLSLSAQQQETLEQLISTALHQLEAELRGTLRPVIESALFEVGTVARTMPERVALAKLCEEILDRLVEREFLTLGDVRDAISRNALKLDDLATVQEFWSGDRLLQLNTLFAERLVGIYKPGEGYLRSLQRLSSLAFGTGVGRFLARYVALPFGGAFVALEALQHFLDFLLDPFDRDAPKLTTLGTVLAVGCFLLAVIYSKTCRGWLISLGQAVWNWLYWGLFKVPGWFFHWPWVQQLFSHPWCRRFRKHLLKPCLVAGVIGTVQALLGSSKGSFAIFTGGAFLTTLILFNTRLEVWLDDLLTDYLVRSYRQLRHEFFPEIIRWILAFFRQMLEQLDRFIYLVDEQLRFRPGDSQVSFLTKASASVFWFVGTYILRFSMNLLIEPQVNPIKHFPVVTVSHKLMMALGLPALSHVLSFTMNQATANTIAVVICTATPGAFGFLAWELKENWRLYRVNQPETLQPVLVGTHGETVARLFRRGFHSGTVPKLYAKKRRAAKRRQLADERKYTQALEHIETELTDFVEREFVQLLKQSAVWGGQPLRVERVRVAPTAARIHLAGPEGSPVAVLAFEEHQGTLLGRIETLGWLAQLRTDSRSAFCTALVGLYKLAGVEVVAEQVERARAAWVDAKWSWSLEDRCLHFYNADGQPIGHYSLQPHTKLKPDYTFVTDETLHPEVPADQVIFAHTAITWERWNKYWAENATDMENSYKFDLAKTIWPKQSETETLPIVSSTRSPQSEQH